MFALPGFCAASCHRSPTDWWNLARKIAQHTAHNWPLHSNIVVKMIVLLHKMICTRTFECQQHQRDEIHLSRLEENRKMLMLTRMRATSPLSPATITNKSIHQSAGGAGVVISFVIQVAP